MMVERNKASSNPSLFLFLFLSLILFNLHSPVAATETSLESGNPAATITVDSLADDLTVNGNCTLREALRAASLNVAYDGCQAGSAAGSDLIVFSVNGTINLTQGEMIITSPVIIQGNGQSQTIIDAGGNSRIFNVSEAIKIESLTLQNGNPPSGNGGAIYGDYTDQTVSVEFDNIIVQNNDASAGGAIFLKDNSIAINSNIDITIRDSVIQGNNASNFGGGIGWVSNPLTDITIIGTVFDDNHAGSHGGAISCSECNLIVTDSVISNNSAPDMGGGIYKSSGNTSFHGSQIINNATLSLQIDYGGGGGLICFFCSTLELVDSTVMNNLADNSGSGAGIYAFFSDVNIERSTFSYNSAEQGRGGGIYYYGATPNNGLVTLNSTISKNTAQFGGGLFIYADDSSSSPNIRYTTIVENTATAVLGAGGAMFIEPDSNPVTLSRNIIYGNIGSPTCYPIGGSISDGFNFLQEISCGNNPLDEVGVDPMLGALMNNGGPTGTHALLLGSPAIDFTPCIGTINVDQRGVARPQGSLCDSGSYEFSEAPFGLYLPMVRK